MRVVEDFERQSSWQAADELKEEMLAVETKEDEQLMFNRVSFEGERILYNMNGAEVAIVPLEDYVLLEAFEAED